MLTRLSNVPTPLQGRAKKWSPGLVNFVTAVAYHFCLSLPAAFTRPGDHLLAEPCIADSERAYPKFPSSLYDDDIVQLTKLVSLVRVSEVLINQGEKFPSSLSKKIPPLDFNAAFMNVHLLSRPAHSNSWGFKRNHTRIKAH